MTDLRPFIVRIVLCPLCLCGAPVSAQVLMIEPGTDDPAILRFNPAFIERNGIAAIHGQPMVKRENEPMRERSGGILYQFDEQGRTTYRNHSFGRPGTGHDTASIIFSYDGSGRVTSELHNDLNGHFILDRELDAEGRVTRETYARVENLGTDRYKLSPGRRTEISDERFAHGTINDTAWSTTFLNSAGLPYRERTWHKDRWGYLRAIDDRWLVSGRRGSITFRYDEKGRPAERIERPDLSAPATTRYEWRYDAAGNVTVCDQWRDQAQVAHQEFIYEQATMLLKATVMKAMDTGLIHVVRYTTTPR